MIFALSEYGHFAVALAYAAYAAALTVWSTRAPITLLLAIAALATSISGGVTLLSEWSILSPAGGDFARAMRDGSWLAVVLAVLYSAGKDNGVWRWFVAAASSVSILHAVLSVAGQPVGSILGIAVDSRLSGLLMVVVGLTLVDNMMRNVSRDQFWSAKFLGIGLFGILAFQLVLVLPEFLTGIREPVLLAVRPLVYLLALPLFVVSGVRSPSLQLRVHSSRKFVFHSTALIGAGILLQGAAVAAYYVRNYGGDGATVLSIVAGFGAAMAIAITVASAGARSRLKNFISENFYSYKYDYRLEWDKFIRALSAPLDGDAPLRALRTLTETLDSSGGALWLLRERWGQYVPAAKWSFRDDFIPIAPDDPCLEAFGSEQSGYIELAASDPRAAPWRRRFASGWLAIPLWHRSMLVGIAVVNAPRAARKLDWEDGKFITLIALQLATYLVQDETAQALADARQMEEFNKRFAFIVHDVKNTIGQLSLLVRNVEKFGDNEEFRKDMAVTLRNSVTKLQELLAQIKGEPGGAAHGAGERVRERVDVNALLTSFVREKSRIGMNIVMPDAAAPLQAGIADEKGLVAVLEHVATNASEAAPEGSPVVLHAAASGAFVRISIADKGPGMTAEFIANELFRPFRTRKRNGFGIGAYQARETIRKLGGDIEVTSKVGEGTVVTLLLPVAVTAKEYVTA
jgi:putative PEP-CTERM system histidine kinase